MVEDRTHMGPVFSMLVPWLHMADGSALGCRCVEGRPFSVQLHDTPCTPASSTNQRCKANFSGAGLHSWEDAIYARVARTMAIIRIIQGDDPAIPTFACEPDGPDHTPV